ncbi:hypothetical protein SAMD00079811_51010 [Scytonema sp. HK-05]|nr:hypothetical protein SAMD00079811_51010 [Scytonema sp. HK-05]
MLIQPVKLNLYIHFILFTIFTITKKRLYKKYTWDIDIT